MLHTLSLISRGSSSYRLVPAVTDFCHLAAIVMPNIYIVPASDDAIALSSEREPPISQEGAIDGSETRAFPQSALTLLREAFPLSGSRKRRLGSGPPSSACVAVGQ
jgi:hypothetical protein